MTQTIKIVFFQRLWQGFSGVVTIYFITTLLAIGQQGWFYSFLSLSSIYTLFDVGLSITLVQISAHYFVRNKWLLKGSCVGEARDVFLSIVKQSSGIYFFIALLFLLVMTPAGIFFFALKESDPYVVNYGWKLPWIFLVISTALNMMTIPFFSIFEGTGLLFEVYTVRFLQGVLGSLFCWIALYKGYFLWAPGMVPLLAFLVAVVWLSLNKTSLFKEFFSVKTDDLSWYKIVWPLQWRIGLTWISAFLLTQIYTPIIFHYQGSVLAGQLGLSLTIANMLGLLSQSWIAHRIPLMAQSVALKNWHSFDEIFKQDFFASSAIYILGSLALFYLYYLLSSTIFINRVLPFVPLAGLFFIVFLNHVIGALSAQLRSYKKEPLVWTSLAGTILTVPIAIFSARYYSVNGVVLAVLIIQLIFTLPLSIRLWFKYNKAWRM
jgi:hypothetical protein